MTRPARVLHARPVDAILARMDSVRVVYLERSNLADLNVGNPTPWNPSGHGGTTGPELIAGILLSKRLINITGLRSCHSVVDLGANDGLVANVAKAIAPHVRTASIENHHGRIEDMEGWLERIDIALGSLSRQNRIKIGWSRPVIIRGSFTEEVNFDVNSVCRFFFNNYNDMHRGDSQNSVERILNMHPIGTTITSLSMMFGSGLGDWTESKYLVRIKGKDMPFERPRSNPDERMKLIIYHYVKGESNNAGRTGRRTRDCDAEELELMSFPPGTFGED